MWEEVLGVLVQNQSAPFHLNCTAPLGDYSSQCLMWQFQVISPLLLIGLLCCQEGGGEQVNPHRSCTAHSQPCTAERWPGKHIIWLYRQGGWGRKREPTAQLLMSLLTERGIASEQGKKKSQSRQHHLAISSFKFTNVFFFQIPLPCAEEIVEKVAH